jgi:ribonuclease J
LLRENADIKVVGSKLTLAFANAKLKERRITSPLIEVQAGMSMAFGPFNLEFVAVNHSIPDALAVAIKTPAGTVLATGDFKMDQLPLDGRITDLTTFARLGQEGIDLFMVDSTNADVPGFTTSERDIMPTLDRIFNQTKRRVIVASFASHVHRIQQILMIAEKHNRKVAFVGRSMVRNMKLAEDLGYLEVPSGLIVDSKNIEEYGDKIVLICTGSQGEPLAALSRMANGDHQIQVGKGDTVVLASSLIPGNENPVFRVINELVRFGAEVIHKGNAMVHVSGHAAAGELLYCYNIVKPRHVMPIHGEWRHLRANAELAIKTGVPREKTIVVDNGIVIDMHDGYVDVAGAVPVGFVYVDGQSIGEITESSLKDRRILGEEGFISVVVVIDSQSGKIVAGPDIHARGFTEDQAMFDDVKVQIEKALAKAVAGGINGTHQLSQVVRKTIGSWVGEEHRRKPMIVPVVIEV